MPTPPDSTPEISGSPEPTAQPTAEPTAEPATTVYPPRPTWGRRLGRTALWGTAIGLTAITTAVGGTLLGLMMPLPGQSAPQAVQPDGIGDLWQSGFRYRVSRPINILVMGIDRVPEAELGSEDVFTGRTDTLLLVRLDPATQSAEVLSIPRDTRLRIPGYGMDKINQANVEGGPELLAATLTRNFGQVPIDRYLRVSTGAFRELVDLVGGVEVFVPKRMVYEDHTQQLYIDLYPGQQTLNGDEAEQFARFRQDANGDIGRVQRQQILLKAMRERLSNPLVIAKLPEAVRILQTYIDTNLSAEEMLALATFALELEPDSLNMVMLPGRFSDPSEFAASYWLPDREATARIMQDFFQADTVATLANSRDDSSPFALRIAVQNATHSEDVATTVSEHLRQQGFYNAYAIRDWPSPQARTQILAQRGDLGAARAVAMFLGDAQVLAESTGDLQSDITIRVGADWLDYLSDTEELERP